MNKNKQDKLTHCQDFTFNVFTDKIIIQTIAINIIIIIIIIIIITTIILLKDNNLSLARAQCTDRVVEQATKPVQ